MHVQSNVSLRPYNTFGLDASASRFVEITTAEELAGLLKDPQWESVPKFILGGGSNILLTQNIDALVIRPLIRGIETVSENDDQIVLKVGAGETWHGFVMHCVDKNYGGVENLSLIPGNVGAAPMQNIGAYGVEVKDVILSVEAIDIVSGDKRVFSNQECRFGYRESIFKKEAKDKYVITSAAFVLSKKPVLNVGYGDVQRMLIEQEKTNPTIRDVSNVIISIRQSKLPDPAVLGNAGSFFKNPEIPVRQYEELKKTFAHIPGYVVDQETMKVPAGWLIEQAGWKGFRQGAAGVHDRQALVLVNHGGATGDEIKILSQNIQKSIMDKFGISLKAEVNFV